MRILRTGYEGVEEIACSLLDELELDLKGRSVLLKPNLLGPFKPERGVTTHPDFVRGIRRCLEARGAEVIVGDNPGATGYGTNERVAGKTGILEAAGPAFVNLASRPVTFPLGSDLISQVVIPKEVQEVDMVISLPKLKTHLQTVITGAVKNSFGFLIGGEKARMHTLAPNPGAFSRLLVDIYLIRPPDLSIMDGIIGMDGNGPSAGRTIMPGLMIASDNAFLLDRAVSLLMGIDPRKVGYLQEGERRGLFPPSGEYDTDLRTIEPYRIKGFRGPLTLLFSRGITGAVLNRLGYSLFSTPDLTLKKDLCNRCRICFESCPSGAMEMTGKGGYPVINREKCSNCYCCHELCPESAWKITGLLGMVRGRD